MMTRFEGKDGRRRLAEALLRQDIIQHNSSLMKRLLPLVKLKEYRSGEYLIRQSGSDCDLFFIFHGKVSVIVNGREIGLLRGAGQHVGEMALVDNSPRSACVKATEPTVVGCLCEPDFTKVANRHPMLWRTIAAQLAKRLRQRNDYVKAPNLVPRIFTGSASESFGIAKEVHARLQKAKVESVIWKSTRVFRPSHTTIDSLSRQVDQSDFGVLILGPDDYVTSRKQKQRAPRDNVLFELGLFMGGISRERTFTLLPRGIKVKKPSDLLGVTDLYYELPRKACFKEALDEACSEIMKVVVELGPK
jgi:CRP/FNR family cyclic AMP-dependent transcriptional regulator